MELKAFFNVHNLNHLSQYRKMINSGQWEPGFLPEDIEDPYLGLQDIERDMKEAWLDLKVGY